jgi:hypothetical protein
MLLIIEVMGRLQNALVRPLVGLLSGKAGNEWWKIPMN